MKKPLKTVWVEPVSWWGRVSGNHHSRGNSVSQIDVDSDMMTDCQICGARAQKRNNDLCHNFSLGESYSSSSWPHARLLSFFLYVSGKWEKKIYLTKVTFLPRHTHLHLLTIECKRDAYLGHGSRIGYNQHSLWPPYTLNYSQNSTETL